MHRTLEAIVGKRFVHPATKEEYGLFRIAESGTSFSLMDGRCFSAAAEDESGNFVTELPDGSVWFWDHETDALAKLADTLDQFISGCSDPDPTILEATRVTSAWIDPAFARSLGIEAPEDGYIKKKS